MAHSRHPHRPHHLAFYYGTGQHLADAVEMFRDYDVRIEAGPDKHGITKGQFLYVFEPGGNRIELFGEAGYLHLDPDAETKTWQMADIDTGLAVGGAKLPWETYFTYGTPSPLALDQHIESTRTWARGGARFGGAGSRAADPGRDRPLPRRRRIAGLIYPVGGRETGPRPPYRRDAANRCSSGVVRVFTSWRMTSAMLVRSTPGMRRIWPAMR